MSLDFNNEPVQASQLQEQYTGFSQLHAHAIKWLRFLNIVLEYIQLLNTVAWETVRITAVYLSFGPIRQKVYCFCGQSVHEKAWRSRKRVAQAS